MSDYIITSDFTSKQWEENADRMESESVAKNWITFERSSLDIVLSIPTAKVCFAIHNITGQVLGSIIGYQIPQTNMFYIGSYFVLEQKDRGKGIGLALWNALVACAKEKGNILLIESVGEMTTKYRSRDFPVAFPYQIQRWKGMTSSIRDAAIKHLNQNNEFEIKLYSQNFFSEILDFDKTVSGRNRRDFLQPLFKLPKYTCLVALDCVSGSVVGYGVKYPTLVANIFRIGPVYGKSEVIYELLVKLLNYEGEAYIYLPTNSKYLMFMKEEAKCTTYITVDRSCSKSYEETVDFSKVFAVSSHLCQPDC